MTEPLKAATFDFYKMAAGATTPEDKVDIYLDTETAYRAANIEDKLNSPSRYYRRATETEDEREARVAALEEELAELKKELEKSRATFTLKGILSTRVAQLKREHEAQFGTEATSDESYKRYNASLLAAHIVRIEDATGAVDEQEWDTDRVEQLFNMLPGDAVQRLMDAVIKLSLDTNYLEKVTVDSDF